MNKEVPDISNELVLNMSRIFQPSFMCDYLGLTLLEYNKLLYYLDTFELDDGDLRPTVRLLLDSSNT